VRSIDEATTATRAYLTLMDAIVAAGIERNLSLKLTQLGLEVDRATCVDNLRRILDPGQRDGFFVRIDMENSPFTQVTLDVFETLWQQGYRNIGVVLQACLHRSEQDVRRMNELQARVRLVKGAYKEPQTAAYQLKSEVDEAYRRLMRVLLDAGNYPAIATHDETMLRTACAYAGRTRHRAGAVRVSDAVRGAAGSADDAGRRGSQDAHLCAIRTRMVPVFHAPAGRAAGECRFRHSRDPGRAVRVGAGVSAPPW
jgi:proline dehydrogenase